MPIDASIPLNVQPLKVESPVNQLAMMGETMKLGELGRSIAEQNKLNEYLQSGADLSSAEGRRGLINYGKTGLGYAKALNEQDLSAANLKKTNAEVSLKDMEIAREGYKNLLFNPSPTNFAAHLEDAIKSGKMAPEKAQQEYKTILSLNEAQRLDYVKSRALKAEQYFSQQETARSNRTNEGIRQGTLNLAKEGQRLQYDPLVQGQIAEGKKIGEARAEGVIAPLKDARANLKALKTAGYDPITGTDRVSDLIKASTSGAVETGLAGAYGAMPGAGATTGQEAIGKLASISKTLTLDLLDGKLGAGISNDDRTALEQRFGDMANSMIPSDKRLAAWGEAKEIMRRAAILPEPGQVAPAAAPSGNRGGKPSLNDIFNPKPN